MAFTQKTFSMVTTAGLLLIQIILLIFWIDIQSDGFYQNNYYFNQTQKIVGCVILTLYFLLLFLCHFLKETNNYFIIGIMVTLVVGQIVTLKGTKYSFWPYLIQAKQVMEIISIIISVVSLTNIQLLRSNYNKRKDTFSISSRQQLQLIFFCAFIIQLVITIYFVLLQDILIVDPSHSHEYQNENYSNRTALRPAIDLLSVIGSTIITIIQFLLIIWNYFNKLFIFLPHQFFGLIAGNILQIIGCTYFQYQEKNFPELAAYPKWFDVTQTVLIEFVLISFFFNIIALVALFVEKKQTQTQLSDQQQQQFQENQQKKQQQVQQLTEKN